MLNVMSSTRPGTSRITGRRCRAWLTPATTVRFGTARSRALAIVASDEDCFHRRGGLRRAIASAAGDVPRVLDVSDQRFATNAIISSPALSHRGLWDA